MAIDNTNTGTDLSLKKLPFFQECKRFLRSLHCLLPRGELGLFFLQSYH